ncbi:MAG TPA: CBS domain-containing protein [Acidimicrobiia bacterium]|nr:CBS domain-containing protein [Acidimicrobiia bacterium]
MPADTLVRDVMSTNVSTLRGETPITEAADTMAASGFGAMPVVDEKGHLLGLLRDDDLLATEARVHVPTFFNFFDATIPLPGEMHHLKKELERIAGSTVADVMDQDPLTIGPDETLEELATRMHDAEISHVPVVDADGKVVGVVARGDIVKFIARTT